MLSLCPLVPTIVDTTSGLVQVLSVVTGAVEVSPVTAEVVDGVVESDVVVFLRAAELISLRATSVVIAGRISVVMSGTFG